MAEAPRLLFGRRPRAQHRYGLTLVEMLISVTLMLILVFALVRVFQMLGDNMRDTKTILEMAGQLRTWSQQLQEDLDRCTVGPAALIDPDAGWGYREVLEGVGTERDIDGDGKNAPADGETADDALVGIADPLSISDVDYHAVLDAAGQPVRDPATNRPRFAQTAKGDRDDLLMFTMRSSGTPFVAQVRGQLQSIPDPNNPNVTLTTLTVGGAAQPIQTLESQEAEVVWWSELDPRGMLRIYRRILLVRPDLRIIPAVAGPWTRDLATQFLRDNDLSVRFVASNPNAGAAPDRVVANSLADLSRRENRYGHFGQLGEGVSSFPFRVELTRVRANLNFTGSNNPSFVHPARLTEFMVLADALSFDVKVYDPQAVQDLASANGPALLPSDPAYLVNSAKFGNPLLARGCFVDLNFKLGTPMQNETWNSAFSGDAHSNSGLNRNRPNADPRLRGVHDTWPTIYERDGYGQRNGELPANPPPLVDAGTNGLDDNGRAGVDDVGEQETAPPYAAELRGIQVSARIWEFNSRQVRQATVVGDFTQGLGS